MKKLTTKITLQKVVILAMLIALGIVLDLYTIGTNVWQISFTFVTNSVIGMVGGPFLSGLAAAVQDVISGTAFSQYAYNWQFTFSSLIVGIIYGFFFYKKKLDVNKWKDWLYVLVAVTVIMLVGSIFFNTLWVSILYDMPFKVTLYTRLPLLLQIVPRTIILMLLLPSLQRIPGIKKSLD